MVVRLPVKQLILNMLYVRLIRVSTVIQGWVLL